MEGNIVKCLCCEKMVTQVGGKKKREFCNGNCRNKYYYREARKGVEPKKKGRPKKTFLQEHTETVEKKRIELANKIAFMPATEKAYDGNQINRRYLGDEIGQMPYITPDPKEKHDLRVKLLEYEAELPTVPDVGAGKQRRKWLQNKIYELKQQLK